MRSFVTSVLAGLALTLAFPPRSLAWLAVPALAVFLWASRSGGWLSGLGFGLAFFGTLFPWLSELGLVAFLPLVLVESAFVVAFAELSRRWSGSDRWWAVAVGGWALAEFARERFPLGGFAWGMVGYPMGTYDATRHATQWIGTSGWSVVLALVAAGLVDAVIANRSRILLAGLVAFAALTAAGAVWNPAPTGREIETAIVQGNVPCLGYHCPDERIQIYRMHLDVNARIPNGGADLVVWPEGSTGSFNADPVLNPEVAEAIGSEAARVGAWMIVGGDRTISDTDWVNANVVFSPDGKIVGEYRKQHPVPFGEYIPARALFDFIPELAAVPRDMIPGDGPKVFDMDFGRVGSVISFESSFARYARASVRDGAQLLVVATSQASYPFSDASDQLIGMTRMRAAELGVDVVHAAVTGRSALITDGGEIAVAALAQPALLTGPVRLRESGPTLYTRWGDWVQWLAIAGLVGVVMAGRRRSSV